MRALFFVSLFLTYQFLFLTQEQNNAQKIEQRTRHVGVNVPHKEKKRFHHVLGLCCLKKDQNDSVHLTSRRDSCVGLTGKTY